MEQKSPDNHTYRVVTLGCRTNQYESQAYRDQLDAMGWQPAQKGEAADLCVVNTCTVTEGADADSRHQIRRLARENPDSRLVVTGCMAEGQPKRIEAMQGVSHVVSNQDKERLLQMVFPDEELPEFQIRRFEAHTRAFVKVQDGCNSFCSYCVIPYVRGRSRSRSVAEIQAEVRGLVASGYKEVVLTGINVGDFDGGGGHNLAQLVRAIDGVEGVERLRVSSIDPDEVDEELLEAIVTGRSTCPSMHIVLQAGSNVVLRRMNRKYTRQCFMETADRLVSALPDFTFTTDVIVGFPGETEYDFQETLDVVKEVRFAKVHVFPYSRRERTRAARLPDHVPHEVVQERKRRLLQQSELSAYQLREQFVGRRATLLLEGEDNQGHTENFLQARVGGQSLPANEFVEVLLQSNGPDGFFAQRVNEGVCYA